MSEKPPKIQELERREAIAMAQGGPKAIAKQHEGGKLTARERIGLLFDPGTFVETDLFMRHRCTDFGMDKGRSAGGSRHYRIRQGKRPHSIRLFPGFYGPRGLPG